jgi:NADPH:quinone reductase-like Zn-dependent oxidoreductase
MRAIVQDAYGPPDVLTLREIDEPEVADDAVLVRVHAASANSADWHFMRGDPRLMRLQAGLRRPKVRVLGCDLAGQIEAVGKRVTSFKPGDEVFGNVFMRGFGAFAERASVREDLLAPKPATLSFEEAAAVPMAGATALQALRDHGRVEPGDRVLIIGAGGGVGTHAVQIAKSLGAEVTGVCSAQKVELVRSLGADRVIDYTREDFAGGQARYDLILQLAGKRSPSECRRALSDDGVLVLSSGESSGHWIGPLGRVFKARLLSPFVSQRLISFTAGPNADDLRTLSDLIQAGDLKPVIDRTCSLADVREAIRYLEDGHARGKVVIAV